MKYEYYDRSKVKVHPVLKFLRNTAFILSYIILKIMDYALTLFFGSILLFLWVWENRKKWIGWMYVKLKKPKSLEFDERKIFK